LYSFFTYEKNKTPPPYKLYDYNILFHLMMMSQQHCTAHCSCDKNCTSLWYYCYLYL